MSTAAVRSPHGYEDAYEAYYAEAAEEVRAVRVGEKETSEQAAIVARHADLFTQEQLDALRAAEAVAPEGDEHARRGFEAVTRPFALETISKKRNKNNASRCALH